VIFQKLLSSFSDDVSLHAACHHANHNQHMDSKSGPKPLPEFAEIMLDLGVDWP
jgi:hypothetical protein